MVSCMLLICLMNSISLHHHHHRHNVRDRYLNVYVNGQKYTTDSISSPSNCTMWSTASVGVMYSSVGIYAAYGKSALVVTRMYESWLAKKCGVGNTGIGLNVILADVQSSVDMTRNATSYLINQMKVSMLVAPEGALANEVGPLAAATRTPVIVGMSGSRSTFINPATGKRQSPTVVGVMTPARNYFAPFMSLMRAQPHSD
jgi:ABC-type branched-subunit amino acid transport system substrate-binding protein